MKLFTTLLCVLLLIPSLTWAQLVKKDNTSTRSYFTQDGKLRVAIAKQSYIPSSGNSKLAANGPDIMANGGIQDILKKIGAVVRVSNAEMTEREKSEYGAWRKMGYANGHLAENVMQNEADGYFTIGFLGTCPSSLGMLGGLQQSLTSTDVSSVGILWLDAHADYNTPETTRSGSLGGMPLAIANGLALHQIRRDSKLDPPLANNHIVTAGLRDVDPLEQFLLDQAAIPNISVDEIRKLSENVFKQMDVLSDVCDKIYIHIDLDILDASEVPFHNYPTEGGPTSQELAALFKAIFSKYPKAASIGFASIPENDPDQVALKAVNRMVAGAIEGIMKRGGK